MTRDAYMDAFEKAQSDLSEAFKQRDYWTLEVAKLEQLVKSLAAVSAPAGRAEQIAEQRDEIGVQDVVFTCIRQFGERLSATDVRDRLNLMGYDLTRYSNPLAVIHSAIKRLSDGKFIEDAVGDGKYSVCPARLGLTPQQAESIRRRAEQIMELQTRYIAQRRGEGERASAMTPRTRQPKGLTPPPAVRSGPTPPPKAGDKK